VRWDYGLAKLFMGVLCKRHSFSWRRACASNVSENVADVNVLLLVPCPWLIYKVHSYKFLNPAWARSKGFNQPFPNASAFLYAQCWYLCNLFTRNPTCSSVSWIKPVSSYLSQVSQLKTRSSITMMLNKPEVGLTRRHSWTKIVLEPLSLRTLLSHGGLC
jgi:hypothetical protein